VVLDNTISVATVNGVTMRRMTRKVPPPQRAMLLFVGTMVLFVVVVRTLYLLHPDMAILFAELLALLVPTVLAVAYLRADFRATLRLQLPTAADVLLAVPLAIALAVLNDQLMNLVNQMYPMPEAERDAMVELLRANTAYEWAVRLFGIVVAAAVSEEILFRGFIQRSLEEGPLGRGGAILLTSFLFAVIHLIPQGMPSYVLAGVVLGITAVATESILIPILIHAVHNTASIFLLNLADMESLGQPVWIPPQILIPAVLIFVIALVYYLRRTPEPEPRNVPSFPRPTAPSHGLAPGRFVGTDAALPVLKRRALGWLVVGSAALAGFLVVIGLFVMSLLYSPQARRQPIRDMQQDLLDALPPSAELLASRVSQQFDALLDFNESGNLGVAEFLRLVWIYSAARSDGTISEEEIEAILSRIRLILRENTRVRHL
jgi:membrane protease YdiL (CAAX protease family)